jgi:hypothetical protein
MTLVKEKYYPVTLVKIRKEEFIQDSLKRYRDPCNGVLQWGRERLGSTLNTAGQLGVCSQGTGQS